MIVGRGDPEWLAEQAWPAWLDHNDWDITLGEYGKPAFTAHPEIHFNKSHTQGAAVIAVADRPVGVDIEAVGRFSERITNRHFTAAEQRYVDPGSPGATIRFAEIWTRKEAFVKWLGTGLHQPLNSFDTLADSRISTRRLQNFVVSVCVDIDALPLVWQVGSTDHADRVGLSPALPGSLDSAQSFAC